MAVENRVRGEVGDRIKLRGENSGEVEGGKSAIQATTSLDLYAD